MGLLSSPLRIKKQVLVFSFIFITSASLNAQILIEEGPPSRRDNPNKPVGTIDLQNRKSEKQAQQYFQERSQSGASDGSFESAPRFMMLQLGAYIDDNQHRWGNKSRDKNAGEMLLGVTYRFGEWVNSMDLWGRVEYQMYDIDNETPKKLSFLPMLAFPDARSGFPLYFAAGAGLGLFVDQAPDESYLSVDYQIVGGLRLLNMFPSGGFVFETGLKGHFHLLRSGQFNGTFVSVGAGFFF